MGVGGVGVVHPELEGVLCLVQREVNLLPGSGEPACVGGEFMNEEQGRFDQLLFQAVDVEDDPRGPWAMAGAATAEGSVSPYASAGQDPPDPEAEAGIG